MNKKHIYERQERMRLLGKSMTGIPKCLDTRIKMSISHAGKTFSKETLDKKTGENHFSFNGYYVTPFGTFPTSPGIMKVTNKISPHQVRAWCVNNKNKVSEYHFHNAKQKYLTTDTIGKTFEELGFSFVKV